MNTEYLIRAVRVFILAALSASVTLGLCGAQRGNPVDRNTSNLTELPLMGKPGTVPGVAGYSPTGTRLDGDGLTKWLNRSKPEGFPKNPNAKKHSEIKCSVLGWNAQLPSPALTLVCPPKLVFAPLYVYFRLTWASPGDAPRDLQSLVAAPRSQTKVEPLKNSMRVWLNTHGSDSENTGGKWVEFNRVSIYHLETD